MRLLYPLNAICEKFDSESIIPIHKKQDRSDRTNYHGISLLNLLGRVFAKMPLK